MLPINMKSLNHFIHLSMICLVLVTVAVLVSPQVMHDSSQASTQANSDVYIPAVLKNSGYVSQPGTEWTQHGHDAQRTGYTNQEVSTPWRWKWAWNGPNSSGGVSNNKTSLPRNVQPITGGGRVYVARGTDGVTALNRENGQELWTNNSIGTISATPAYDTATDFLFVTSSNGKLYRLNAQNGSVSDSFNAGTELTTPPALISDRIFISAGNQVYAVNKSSMNEIWHYAAGSTVQTPPSYSVSYDQVIVGTQDLYVHAIDNMNGSRVWRKKPSIHTQSDPDVEFLWGWPVIADNEGLVLMKYRLAWESLWPKLNPQVYPTTNSAIRQYLQNNPGDQVLFAMKLSDGTVPFISNVGNGGWGDGGNLPMGPQPVVKRFADGSEVVYMVGRGGSSNGVVTDARWDSLFVEMMLDNNTVPGYSAGEVRFMKYVGQPGNNFILTDEQPFITMAGDYLLGGHWMAGYALEIVDRADWRGAWDIPNRIDTINAPHFVASLSDQTQCQFSSSHYCSSYLEQDEDRRVFPQGFYIYYNAGTVYGGYWSRYAAWVVSDGLVLYRSSDGAIVALEHGNPTGGNFQEVVENDQIVNENVVDNPAAFDRPSQGSDLIDFTVADEHVGEEKSVQGEVMYVFDNRKAYYLGYQNPHQGAFAALIKKEYWDNFPKYPGELYKLGDQLIISGKIVWYQGDPVIYVTDPSQIQILR